jgi:hypothetical protein
MSSPLQDLFFARSHNVLLVSFLCLFRILMCFIVFFLVACSCLLYQIDVVTPTFVFSSLQCAHLLTFAFSHLLCSFTVLHFSLFSSCFLSLSGIPLWITTTPNSRFGEFVLYSEFCQKKSYYPISSLVDLVRGRFLFFVFPYFLSFSLLLL